MACTRLLGILLLLSSFLSTNTARADLIISNLPLTGQWVGMSIANHPSGWKYYEAEGFTMGDVPAQLVDVVLDLDLGAWGIPIFPPIADLYSDAGGFPATHLTALEPVIKPCFPCTLREDYMFLPQTSVVLQPHETYWIRASVHDQGFYYWNASLPDQVPAGPYATAMPDQWTFFRGFWETHKAAFGAPINMGYAVDGIPLPETGTVFLVAAGGLCILLSRFAQNRRRRSAL